MTRWIPPLLLLSAALAACQGSERPPSPSTQAGSPSAPARGGQVDGAQARTLVAEGATLLDVRSVAEYASGHVEGAHNLPVQELEARLTEVPRGAPVVVYCQSGGRSAAAARMLRSAGYETYDLGPMSAW